MTEIPKNNQEPKTDSMKITVTKNGPYIVTGNVPLQQEEICNDKEGNCHTWRKVKQFPEQEMYALCRCGHSQNKPFCDGTHVKIHFNGEETAGNESYLLHPRVISGPELELDDFENLCVHARFCMRAGGIWNLTKASDVPKAKSTAIEESCHCPSGRLVIRDKKTGKIIEPELEKSIALIEYPPRGEHGPIWVRGSIPVTSEEGKPYIVRNRVTLCRCGKSGNKPFCDGSHIQS
ncbi:MAG: CDGSH iron-sulfur domain-containing protein [Methanoregula sp.]|uniref:CDGSH iron-sulfur domain-containing protein n=1 Tax=Methanoregula sp. TaxID=2052170 RepID=UPI003BB10BD0